MAFAAVSPTRSDPTSPGRTATATALAPLHPWSTGAFILAAGYVVAGAVLSNPANALRGTLMLAAGVPAYVWWRRRAATGAQLE